MVTRVSAHASHNDRSGRGVGWSPGHRTSTRQQAGVDDDLAPLGVLAVVVGAVLAHPTYQAMIELCRAQKTIFLCRSLRSRELQREIEEGLSSSRGIGPTALSTTARPGELSSNRVDEQELSVQCPRIVQASLVYVNTLMIQDLIDGPDTGGILVTAADKRGVTPLFCEHVLPCGEVELNMSSRLTLSGL